jgi:hypothetical protein
MILISLPKKTSSSSKYWIKGAAPAQGAALFIHRIAAMPARSSLVNTLPNHCGILVLRSIKSSAGIAGKDLQ